MKVLRKDIEEQQRTSNNCILKSGSDTSSHGHLQNMRNKPPGQQIKVNC